MAPLSLGSVLMAVVGLAPPLPQGHQSSVKNMEPFEAYVGTYVLQVLGYIALHAAVDTAVPPPKQPMVYGKEEEVW